MVGRVKIEGDKKLINRLKIWKNLMVDGSVVVGYTANYAIYVHEMVGAKFKRPKAEAKFLEKPFRKGEWKEVYREEIKKGKPIMEALVKAGLLLQRRSQEICPVDTGNLRASAFTRKERK